MNERKPTWNHIFKLQRHYCRGAHRSPKLLALGHTVVKAPKTPSQGGVISDCYAGVMAELRNIVYKYFSGRGGSRSAFRHTLASILVFLVGRVTHVKFRLATCVALPTLLVWAELQHAKVQIRNHLSTAAVFVYHIPQLYNDSSITPRKKKSHYPAMDPLVPSLQ